MIATINPSAISGTVIAPASKSCMQRACALALLAPGTTRLINPGKSNDDLAALDIIQKLGAGVSLTETGELVINSTGFPNPASPAVIHCGESGLGIRMFAPVAALSASPVTLTGTGSLLQRPMHFFEEVFPRLQVAVQLANGYLPLTLKGPLQPADITVDGSLSSQFLTGLLIAFAKSAQKPVTINVNHLISKPYINLTLHMLKQFGYAVEHDQHARFIIHPRAENSKPAQTPQEHAYTVEGDWSSAAFLLVAGAIAGNLTVKGLDVFSTQADKAILTPLMDCGAVISVETEQITAKAPFLRAGSTGQQNSDTPGALKAFHFDATDCPDLFPPLVALAANCAGTTVIEGVSRLRHKESNRALTLQQEFAKMGVEITLQEDMMLITGTPHVKGATVTSHHDHRIAMACAVAALQASGATTIEEAEVVNKSYPQFFHDLKLLDADVSLR